jgi:hypothetical protein
VEAFDSVSDELLKLPLNLKVRKEMTGFQLCCHIAMNKCIILINL